MKNGLYPVLIQMLDGVKGRAGGPPKRQFSRDITMAGGYLMASRPARMYTAPDHAGSFALRSVPQQTMKATRPVQ
jgi:hypothetical protein